MKSTLTTQLDKFNAKAAKAAALNQPAREVVEQKIAAQLEERKEELSTIATLSNSISMLSSQVQHRDTRLEDMEKKLAEMDDKLNRLLNPNKEKTEFEIKFDTILSMHERGLLVTHHEMVGLGVDRFVSPLHKHRMDQIRETGDFTDPISLAGWQAIGLPQFHITEEAEEEQDAPVVVVTKDIVPAVKKKEVSVIKMPRGPKPARIKEAMSVIERHTRETSGRYDWKEGGVDLIFAILTFGQWRGIKVQSAGQVQTDVQTRKAYQQVTLHKEQYGVNSWSDLIAKFEMEAN